MPGLSSSGMTAPRPRRPPPPALFFFRWGGFYCGCGGEFADWFSCPVPGGFGGADDAAFFVDPDAHRNVDELIGRFPAAASPPVSCAAAMISKFLSWSSV